ncbi:hypothetical protein [Methanobrevibacter sp.]|uniref:hypothetical protein n=1 Tax=Methanobrevibacter sp. TaxID=66852 RepID=UPI00388E7D02
MPDTDYICDACGFISTEKRGVYKCPVCGNQMRVASYQVDSTAGVGRLLIYFLLCVIVLPICIAFLGVIGIPVFIVIFILARHYLKNKTSNNAIRTTPVTTTVKNPNKIYTCQTCGGNFKGQQPNCPHCGIRLTYNE